MNEVDNSASELTKSREMSFARQLRYVVLGPFMLMWFYWAVIFFYERNQPIDWWNEVGAALVLSCLLLPFLYLVASLPAFIIGHIDELLFRRQVGFVYRWLLCSLVGTSMLIGPSIVGRLTSNPKGSFTLWLQEAAAGGAFVLIATAVCCAWSDRAFKE